MICLFESRLLARISSGESISEFCGSEILIDAVVVVPLNVGVAVQEEAAAERRFACGECGQTFPSNEALQSHAARRHGHRRWVASVVEGRTCGRGAIGEVGKPPATANPNARKRKPGQRGPDKIAKKRRRRRCGVCKRTGCPGSGGRALCNYEGTNKQGKRAAGKQIANKRKP